VCCVCVLSQVERRPGVGRYWIVTSSLTLFEQFLYLLRSTVAAAARSRTQLCPSNHRHDDVTSGSGTAATSAGSSSCRDMGTLPPTRCLGSTSNEAMTSQAPASDVTRTCADMTSQAASSDVSMTRNDVDMTSYSLLSSSDVSQLLPPDTSIVDEGEEADQRRRLSEEVREIRRDLADIRACAQLVGARCHDDRWRRGDALTLGVAEALTPRTTLHGTTHSPARRWADDSTIADWRIDDFNIAPDDESQLEYESRDRKLSLTCPAPAELTSESQPDYESRDSDYTDRRLSSLTGAEPMMTSSPAEGEDSVADIYIDDELDDVIA